MNFVTREFNWRRWWLEEVVDTRNPSKQYSNTVDVWLSQEVGRWVLTGAVRES